MFFPMIKEHLILSKMHLDFFKVFYIRLNFLDRMQKAESNTLK